MRATFDYAVNAEQYLAALKSNQRRLLREPQLRRAINIDWKSVV